MLAKALYLNYLKEALRVEGAANLLAQRLHRVTKRCFSTLCCRVLIYRRWVSDRNGTPGTGSRTEAKDKRYAATDQSIHRRSGTRSGNAFSLSARHYSSFIAFVFIIFKGDASSDNLKHGTFKTSYSKRADKFVHLRVTWQINL